MKRARIPGLTWLRARLARRTPTSSYSLRRRLLLTTLGSSVVCWLVSLAIIVGVAWHETSEVFDDALEEGARLATEFGANLQRDGKLTDDEISVDHTRHRVRLAYQLIDDDGRMLRRAERAPKQPFVAKPDKDEDFYNAWADGKFWRVHVRRSKDLGFSVQIGQRWDDRSELLSEMAENLVWPALGLLLLLGLLNWFAIRHLLQPLERIAAHIQTKSPDDLSAVPDAGQARELQSIILSLNTVFGRLDEAMHAERRFTADAAHELRTPLAALRMKVQLMQRRHGATTLATPVEPHGGDGGLKAELQLLRDDVDRSTALVKNLLALARLDPQQPQTLDKQLVDLRSLVDEVLQTCGPAAQAKDILLENRVGKATLAGNRPLLASALRNLVDNAVRYGGTGGRVRIEVDTESSAAAATGAPGLRIAVRDDGPGVSLDDRLRLTQRFFRVLGSEETGSGLGLSIVARIAALHGGELSFEQGLDGRGLSAVMTLPAA